MTVHLESPISPFDVPELALVIFQHLETRDLLRCIYVDRAWYRQCFPLLFRSVSYLQLRDGILKDMKQQKQVQAGQGNSDEDGTMSRQRRRPKLAAIALYIERIEIILTSFIDNEHERDLEEKLINHLLGAAINVHTLRVYALWPFDLSLERCARLQSLVLTTLDPLLARAVQACVHLTSLEVLYTVEGAAIPLLAKSISRLPCLKDLFLDMLAPLEDGQGETLIGAGYKNSRWRNIALHTIGPLSAEAIAGHCATLMSLEARASRGVASGQWIRILASSPRLHTFKIMADQEEFITYAASPIQARDFIDRDNATRTLRSWACESTLQIFAAPITGIPRPDVRTDIYGMPRQGLLEEAYVGESCILQHRVYERLSRFSRLQQLQLGHLTHRCADAEPPQQQGQQQQQQQEYNPNYQYECVDLSLDNGLLCLLVNLQELRRLSFVRMATKVTTREVDWMVAAWPKLETIEGLHGKGEGGRGSKVAAYLKERYPHIRCNPRRDDDDL